jgi:hypothetical protein
MLKEVKGISCSGGGADDGGAEAELEDPITWI